LEEKYQALNPKFQVPLVLEFLEKKKNRIKKTKGKRKKKYLDYYIITKQMRARL